MPEAGRGGAAARVMMSLKLIMRSRQVTYAELGRRIRLSEASMKRIFSRATLSLVRLEQICQALDVSIQEVMRLAAERTADSPGLLTLEQETALAADPNLLACFYLLANGRTGREIGVELGTDERAVRRWMVKLDALRLIELRSKLRGRTRAASVIAWRKDGPLRRRYEKQIRQEFLQSSFSASAEALHFVAAELSQGSYSVLLRKIERLAAEFQDLAELDRALPANEKRSVAALLAVRPWVFSMFDSLRQPAPRPTTIKVVWLQALIVDMRGAAVRLASILPRSHFPRSGKAAGIRPSGSKAGSRFVTDTPPTRDLPRSIAPVSA
jgi:DNA-binding Xre family transcriptional regulator